MRFKFSLIQRIVVVFALMSTLVAGVFAVGIVATVHVVEKRLTTIGLGGNLHRLLLADNADSWLHRPEKDELFYAQNAGDDLELPADLSELPVGFGEVRQGEQTYYAMVEIVDGRKYVLLRDQDNYKKREQVLFAVVFTGLILSIGLAIGLGWILARRVVAPVIRLARQVRHRDQLLAVAPPLAADYAHDEVGALAVSFDETLGLLRSALRREQLFTSDVSHELRTPLMVLASSCELLLANPDLDSRAQAQITRIARASNGMKLLVETFLLLARAEDHPEQRAQDCTLYGAAEELYELWRKPIEDKGLQFIWVVEPEAESNALYNLVFLHSVMGNLLRNAWHYTDTGFIRLTLQAQAFSVEDSGIGIPEQDRSSVFQPFVRIDEQRGEGLGLGLSLVQRICSNQGWTVRLTGREPNGCRFDVQLSPSI